MKTTVMNDKLDVARHTISEYNVMLKREWKIISYLASISHTLGFNRPSSFPRDYKYTCMKASNPHW